MKWLYGVVLLVSILIPLGFSFDKKLAFYKKWKFIIPSIVTVGAFFLVFDIYFTSKGVWGFNPKYHSNILLLGLPIEEWLFFIVIPYASIFLHDSFYLYFPDFHLSKYFGKAISSILIILFLILIFYFHEKEYTFYILTITSIAILSSFLDKRRNIDKFYVTFLIILIPFLLVNSLLTGSFIKEPVFWYNENEILGIRVFSIPVEDIGYAFSLIYFNLIVSNKIKSLSDSI